MIDIFRLEDPTPFECRMGLLIWENDEGDLVVVLGHPTTREETAGEWTMHISNTLELLARNFDQHDCLDDMPAHELWNMFPKAPNLLGVYQ